MSTSISNPALCLETSNREGPSALELGGQDGFDLARIASLHEGLARLTSPEATAVSRADFSASASRTALVQTLATELSNQSDGLEGLRGEQASYIVRIIQDWLDAASRTHPFRRAAIALLIRIATSSGCLPPSLRLRGIECEPGEPAIRRDFTTIHHGTYQGEKVAVKRLLPGDGLLDTYARLCREALIWRQLRHPFIMPFLGVDDTSLSSDVVGLVVSGSWPRTLRECIHTGFVQERDRYHMLDEIAQALGYLHDQGLVHGDINDDTIFISDQKHAQLAHFDMGPGPGGPEIDPTPPSTRADACAWTAPERIGKHGRTVAGDVYAYGCLVYLLNAKHRLYPDLPSDAVLLKISQGERPERPPGLEPSTPMHDRVWNLITRCWSQKPGERPHMKEIVTHLRAIRLVSRLATLPIDTSVESSHFGAAAAAARFIKATDAVSYGPDVMGPAVQPGGNLRERRLVYDRDFLLQFQPVCSGRPQSLTPDLQAFGLEPHDRARIPYVRSGRQPAAEARGKPTPGQHVRPATATTPAEPIANTSGDPSTAPVPRARRAKRGKQALAELAARREAAAVRQSPTTATPMPVPASASAPRPAPASAPPPISAPATHLPQSPTATPPVAYFSNHAKKPTKPSEKAARKAARMPLPHLREEPPTA